MRRILLLISIFLGFAVGFSGSVSAQQPEMPPGYWLPYNPPYGYAAKKPVITGACAMCPWGALAVAVRDMMKPYGWDVQLALNNGGADSIRTAGNNIIAPADLSGERPQPYAKADFGATGATGLYDAYHSQGQYAADGPDHYKHLRLVARIDQPSYFVVAVKEVTGITDLKQIIERKIPVRIHADAGERANAVLAYYGLTREVLASFGGSFVAGGPPAAAPAAGRGAAAAPPAAGRGGRGPTVPRNEPGSCPRFCTSPATYPDAEVYLYNAVMANNPESNLMYQITQRQRLIFLQLPDDLLAKLAGWSSPTVVLPQAYFAGVMKDIKTVGGIGQVVYARADAPADAVYAIAKAIDEQKYLLKYKVLPFSYDAASVTNLGKGSPLGEVPLHPGAARYYRQVGYLK